MLKTTAVLVVLMAISSCSRNEPQTPMKPSMQTSIPTPRFDGARAFADLKAQTDFGPRTPLSTGHRACLSFLVAELEKSAETVVSQNFTEKGYNNESLLLTNVFASFNTHTSQRVLLLAHWVYS